MSISEQSGDDGATAGPGQATLPPGARKLLDILSDAAAILTLDATIVEANQSLVRLAGRERCELIGQSCEVLGLSVELFRDGAFLKSLRDGETMGPVEATLTRSDKTTADVEFSMRSGSESGRRLVFLVAHDVTRERQLETTLAEGRRQQEAVIAGFPGVIFQFTEGQKAARFLHGTVRETLGAAEAELGDDIERHLQLVHTDDRAGLHEALREAARTGRICDHAFRYGLDPNQQKWIRLHARPENTPAGVCWTGVLFDVTEERRIELQLRHAQRLEAMGDLTAGIAHNFNNALTVLLPNIQHAMKSATPESERALRDAEKAAHSAADLVRQLMFLARPVSDSARRKMDLGAAVDELASLCRRTLPSGIRIECQTEPGVIIRAVPTDLQQSVLNLVINARDALEHTRDPVIRLTVRREGNLAVFMITDNGSGMPESVLSHVGEPFFSTKGNRGTGLGLASVYRLIREHGGRIQVRSAVGQGTEFRIEQDLAPAEAPAESESSVLPFEALGLGHHRILVVDDDELVRTAVTRQLEALGMSVDAVGSGAAAIEYLGAGHQPEAMLLDLSMPRMSGEQTLRVIRERFPRLPVAIMTGYAQDHLEPASDVVFLTKPFPLGALANGLYYLLRRAGT